MSPQISILLSQSSSSKTLIINKVDHRPPTQFSLLNLFVDSSFSPAGQPLLYPVDETIFDEMRFLTRVIGMVLSQML